MPCKTVALPDGGYAIVCYSRRAPKKCHYCGAPAPVLCDHPKVSSKNGTCDRPCCKQHSKRVGPDKDYCQDHA